MIYEVHEEFYMTNPPKSVGWVILKVIGDQRKFVSAHLDKDEADSICKELNADLVV